MNTEINIPKLDSEKNRRHSIGIISDLHLGSLYFDLEDFQTYLKQIELRKISTVICIGDLFEFNDLNANRISKEDFVQNINNVVSLINKMNIKIISIQGNQDLDLSNKFPNLFKKLINLFGDKLTFIDSEKAQINFHSTKIAIGHYYEFEKANFNATIGAHTHILKTQGTFLNPGTFRRHFREPTQTGGLIISSTPTGILNVIPIGEAAKNSDLIKDLEEEGHYPQIIEFDSMENPQFNAILSKLRKIDPNCVLWLTGSVATKHCINELGSLTRRYKLDKKQQKIFLSSEKEPDYNVFVPLSDWDLEIISEILTDKDINLVIKNLYLQGILPTPIRKIEICCYKSEEIDEYFQLGNSNIEHNYFLYRFLLAPKATLDNYSKEILEQYVNQALLYLKNQLQLSKSKSIAVHKTILTAQAYITEFKKLKHQLMKGSMPDTSTSKGKPLFHYLNSKINPTPLATPPYYTKQNKSFKTVFPNLNLFPQIATKGKEKIIAPPLSAYSTDIHIGQAISVFVGSLWGRFFDKEFNPFMFQTTGPYWDKQNLNSSDVSYIIEYNIKSIINQLQEFGLHGEVFREDNEKNILVMRYIIEQWMNLGLILKSNHGISLKIGAALTFFGGLQIFNDLSAQRLKNTLLKYQREDKVLNLFPVHGKSEKHPFIVNDEELYPTFSVLGLPYQLNNHFTNLSIFCGVNIATQFALGHAIAAKTLNPRNRLTFTSLQLITDSSGKRLTRFNDSRPNLDNLTHTVQKTANRRHNKILTKSAIKFAVIFGLLAHSSSNKSRILDMRIFQNGVKVFLLLQKIPINLKSINYHDVSILSDKNKQLIKTGNFSKLMSDYNLRVKRLVKNITKQEINKLELQKILTITWLIGGEWVIKNIFRVKHMDL